MRVIEQDTNIISTAECACWDSNLTLCPFCCHCNELSWQVATNWVV